MSYYLADIFENGVSNLNLICLQSLLPILLFK